MSIRNKFVVSNMLMVIVPVAIITAVILLTTLSITYFSTSKMSFDPSFGSYLLYKTQFNVSSLEDQIKTPKKSDTDRLGAMDKKRIAPLRAGITKSGSGMEDRISDAVLGACANIQRDGSDIMILANDEIIYKTVEADVYEMVGAVIDICGKSLSDINSPFVTSDDSGTVVTDVFSVEGEGVVKIIVVNKNLNAIVSSGIYSSLCPHNCRQQIQGFGIAMKEAGLWADYELHPLLRIASLGRTDVDPDFSLHVLAVSMTTGCCATGNLPVYKMGLTLYLLQKLSNQLA